jgi:hypothetical protein
MRDHGLDAQDLQHASDPLPGIGFISRHLTGDVPRRRPCVGQRYRAERFFDVRRFMILAGTNVGSERDGVTTNDQVELRPKPAS